MVRRSDEIRFSLVQKTLKGTVTEFPRGGLQAELFLFGLGGTIGGKGKQRHPPEGADLRHETGIPEAVRSPYPVLAVDGGKEKAVTLRPRFQHMQKRHRIGAARHRRAYPFSRKTA